MPSQTSVEKLPEQLGTEKRPDDEAARRESLEERVDALILPGLARAVNHAFVLRLPGLQASLRKGRVTVSREQCVAP